MAASTAPEFAVRKIAAKPEKIQIPHKHVTGNLHKNLTGNVPGTFFGKKPCKSQVLLSIWDSQGFVPDVGNFVTSPQPDFTYTNCLNIPNVLKTNNEKAKMLTKTTTTHMMQ